MIHYQVRCAAAHEFDGWFRDSAGFDRQAGRGLISCPTCGDTRITRALMAPALARGEVAPSARENVAPPMQAEQAPPASSAAGAPPASMNNAVTASAGAAAEPTALAGRMPDHVRAMLQRLRGEVERHCDYVGPEFAAEARRIHSGEAPRRGIYGETTQDQAEALAEDGIGFSRIPWVPRADG